MATRAFMVKRGESAAEQLDVQPRGRDGGPKLRRLRSPGEPENTGALRRPAAVGYVSLGNVHGCDDACTTHRATHRIGNERISAGTTVCAASQGRTKLSGA